MKVVLEFGVRGGPFAESIILPSQKLGAEMASNLVRVLSGNNDNSIERKAQWNVRKNIPPQELAKFQSLCFAVNFGRRAAWACFCTTLEEKQCHALTLATQSRTSLFTKDCGR